MAWLISTKENRKEWWMLLTIKQWHFISCPIITFTSNWFSLAELKFTFKQFVCEYYSMLISVASCHVTQILTDASGLHLFLQNSVYRWFLDLFPFICVTHSYTQNLAEGWEKATALIAERIFRCFINSIVHLLHNLSTGRQ